MQWVLYDLELGVGGSSVRLRAVGMIRFAELRWLSIHLTSILYLGPKKVPK